MTKERTTMEDSAAYKVIIAATDGSAAALEAVKHAVSLAKVYAASLRVVYVANVHISFHLGTYQQMAIDILKEEGNRAVDEAVGLAKDAGLQDVSGVVLTGNPRQDLVAWAEEQGADLMVLGSHGYSRFSALMIGSVADYVVHNAPCSVLLVRGEADNKTGKSDQ